MAMLPPDPLFIFKSEMSPVTCLTYRITPYLNYVYAGTQSGKIHIWNLKTNREIHRFESSKESCLSLNITNDDTLITQDKAGVIKFWTNNNKDWTCIEEFTTDYYGFCKCILNDNVLYCPIREAKMQMISLISKEPNLKFSFQETDKLGEIMAFKLIKLGLTYFLLITFESGHLYLWDLEKRLKINEMKFEDCPMALDFDVTTMKGVFGSHSEKVVVFYLDKNFEFHVKKQITLVNPGVACVSIRPDSKVFGLGCWDGKLRLYSWKSLVILAVLDTHSATVQDLCFFLSNDSRYLLAAGSKDTRISLWDLYN